MAAAPSPVNRVPPRRDGPRNRGLLVASVARRMASWSCIHSFRFASVGPGNNKGDSISQEAAGALSTPDNETDCRFMNSWQVQIGSSELLRRYIDGYAVTQTWLIKSGQAVSPIPAFGAWEVDVSEGFGMFASLNVCQAEYSQTSCAGLPTVPSRVAGLYLRAANRE